MNKENRAEAALLRALSSHEAANYLLEKYADSYPVTLRRRSWEVEDQFRLARHFIQGRALASDRAYEDFLSFMSLRNFLKVVEAGIREIPEDRMDLLLYYLVPALRRVAKTATQKKRVEEFIDRWSTGP